MPEEVEDRFDEWEQIASGTWFFEEAERAVQRHAAGDLAAAAGSLAEWCTWLRYLSTQVPRVSSRPPHSRAGSRDRLTQENLDKLVDQVLRARALVWCAQHALASPDRFQSVEHACEWFDDRVVTGDDEGGALNEFLDSPDHKPWVWIAIRTLTAAGRHEDVDNAEGSAFWSVTEPIAFWNEEAALRRAGDRARRSRSVNGEGVLADLTLDVLSLPRVGTDSSTRAAAVAGRVAQHPADALAWGDYDPDFRKSLERAWRAALALYQERHASCRWFDARWRLTGQLDHLRVSGASSSGAAARGWYVALEHEFEDPRVVTLAEVDEDNVRLLTGVDGVSAKTRAIAEAGRFDTIAVATQENEIEANRVLRKRDAIRVVDLDGEMRARTQRALRTLRASR